MPRILERIPPHNDEAEKSVLGAILIDNEIFYSVSEFLTDEDFYSQAHQEIFRSMVELYKRGEKIDAITVSNCLIRRGSLETVGGRAYVALLSTVVPTTANAVQYGKLVSEKAMLRKLISASGKITEEAFSEKMDSRDVLDGAEKAIFEIARKNQTGDYSYISDVMTRNIDAIKEAEARGGGIAGLTTGYDQLDKLTKGLKPADLVIVAARPSMGKTALGLNIALNVATKSNSRIVIFSLEMPDTGLGLRLLAQEARVDLSKLQTGDLSVDDWQSITAAAEKISKSDIIIDQSTTTGVMDMRNKCRRISAEKKIDLVVIDYMQLMASDGRTESRQLEMAQISRQLKQLARELECPIIAISQLSRAAEKRSGDNRPMLSDLRDSGAIEQDADIVMFIYRADYYKNATETKDNIGEVIVAKNRNGETGSAFLTWLPQYTKFANRAAGDIPPMA